MPVDRPLLVQEVTGTAGLVRLPEFYLAETTFLPRGLLSVGASQPRVYRCIEPGAPPGTVGLSPDLFAMLGDAAGKVPLRVRATAAGIDAGPVVGIAAGKAGRLITGARLRALRDHLLSQPDRGGLFVAFDTSSLRPGEGSVRGHCYLGGGRWSEGTYPLPRAVFRRYGADPQPQTMRALAGRGVRFFNERTFGKLEAYRWMHACPGLRSHLPETFPLEDGSMVLGMVRRWGSAYVKPVYGSLGLGILRVEQALPGFRVVSPRGTAVRCKNGARLTEILSRRLPARGLVQQGLNLRRADGRLVDFRTVAQRDGRGRWTIAGIIGRYGGHGLPVSNVSRGGRPVSEREALEKLFGPSPAELRRRRGELRSLGLAAAAALDASGLLLGDLGLDLAYDESNHPWILEANCRDPHHHLARDAGCWKLFYRLRGTPVEFARYLAGFGEEEASRDD